MSVRGASGKPAPGAAIVLLVAATTIGSACDAPQRPRPPTPDKRALFGDAALVPTREGERIRRELAAAGELESAIRLLAVDDVHVDLDARDPSPRLTIVARAQPDAEIDGLRESIATLARAARPDIDATIVIDPGGGEQRRGRQLTPWIALALLGLGASLGISVERLRPQPTD